VAYRYSFLGFLAYASRSGTQTSIKNYIRADS
jgi:hypothetical protein